VYRRIMIATDGSSLSRKAVASAVELAAAVKAKLFAVYVVPRYPLSYFEGGLSLTSDQVGRVEKDWAEKGQSVVDAVTRAAAARGVEAQGIVSRSDLVSEAVMAAARKHRCDLIVMASHGRRGLKRLLLGSETQQVLTHSTTPVLVLR
jgi:nucleotide-binding universal stress UspA family protein